MVAKQVLLGPDGEPIRRETLTAEIAGPTITGVRSPISGYPGDGLNPRRLAGLLREADQGEPLRFFELAEQIEERDLHYAGVLGTRKRQVSQLEVTVEAASDDADDVKRADMVRDWLRRDELQDEMFDLLDAIGKGVSFTEIIWDTSEGDWWPRRLEWRDPRWFRFDRNDGRTPLLRNDGGDIPLPAFKFITATIRAKSGLPVRSGIARLAAWFWMFKAFTQRDWAIFTQTFGQPVRVGKYPSGATEADKDTLFNAVANIAGDCAAIIPEAMLIDFVESKNVGQGSDLYEKRSNWLDAQVSKAVLGQTGTTDATPGKLGGSNDHTQVREDIERSDAKAVGAIINRDLIRAWCDLEYGPGGPYPRVRIGRAEEKDLTQLVTGIKDLVPLGLRVEKSWINDQLGIPDPDTDAELLAPRVSSLPFGMPPSEEPPALNASSQPIRRATDAVDDLATAAETVAQPGADALIDVVRALVQGAHSLDEVRDGLLKLNPLIAQTQLAALLRLALLMAKLSGRAEIADAGSAT